MRTQRLAMVSVPAFPIARTLEEWIEQGKMLAQVERTLGWAFGIWWNSGEAYGDRVAIVSAPDWAGPSLRVCRNYAAIANSIDVSRRRDTLSFKHHAEVAALPVDQQEEILTWADKIARETGEPPPTRMMRQEVKRRRRSDREEELAAATERAAERVGRQLYSVIYADPPWRYESWSNETGMDRAPDNHYPTMSTAEICAIDVPAAANAVLFLWRTPPMMVHAMRVMTAWGFDYRTEWIWTKPHAGLGYWNRSKHEVLMLGVRGRVPAPAPGDQFDSVIQAKLGKHSEKPVIFRQMIDAMFTSQRGLEMFSRSNAPGWDSWGNQVQEEAAA
jgi:N6-adenosine-specific RNA methylase IME4